MKITVLGDIMCEEPILKASKNKDGTYSFDEVFQQVKPMLEESDHVIANLEFPIAGEDVRFVYKLILGKALTENIIRREYVLE